MHDHHKQAVIDAFSGALETLAFMFADLNLGADDNDDDDHRLVRAAMQFHGPFSGEIELIVTSAFCSELRANIVGEESLVTMADNANLDALMELLNITCGQVLTAIAGETPVFVMSLPTISAVDEDLLDDPRTDDDAIAFVVDDLPVWLRFNTENTDS